MAEPDKLSVIRDLYSPFPFGDWTTWETDFYGLISNVRGATANLLLKYPQAWTKRVYGDSVLLPLTPDDEQWMRNNIWHNDREKRIYDVLNSHPHPHLLNSVLHIPEGILMPLMETTLQARLDSPTVASPERQERWI